MKIFIGSDHAGLDAKSHINHILRKHTIEFEDMGCFSKKSVDYPHIAKEVCSKVLEFQNKKNIDSLGILICGSGTGMQIAANKIPGIRASFAYDAYGAKMARYDNDANVLTLRARQFDWDNYETILLAFLNSTFSNEARHSRRIDALE